MAGTISNIKVQPCEVEWASSSLGYVDGDIEVSLEEQGVDITAHEEGTNVLDMIRTGKNVEVSMTLKEVDVTQWQRIFENGSGASDSSQGTEVIGWGNSKDFTQVTTQASKLVLHPVVNSASDYSEDIAFWKAYPVPGSIVISGENPQTMAVTFRVFPDTAKADGIRLFVYGDHTQY